MTTKTQHTCKQEAKLYDIGNAVAEFRVETKNLTKGQDTIFNELRSMKREFNTMKEEFTKKLDDFKMQTAVDITRMKTKFTIIGIACAYIVKYGIDLLSKVW